MPTQPTLPTFPMFPIFVSSSIRPSFRTFFLFLCILFVVPSCQKSQLRDDWETIAEQKASTREKALKQRAMIAIGKGNNKQEAETWTLLLSSFPQGYYAGLAHMRLGLIAYRKKQWDIAARHFKASRTHPLSRQERTHILMKHANALFHSGRYSEVRNLLKAHYSPLPRRLKQKALQLLIKVTSQQKNDKQAFHWRMKLLTLEQGQDQQKLKTKLIQYIKTVSMKHLLLFVRHHPKRLDFPLDYMVLRLARLLYQKDKYKESKQWLRLIVKQVGIGHPLYQKARKLLAEVEEVRRPADPLTIGVIYPMSGAGVVIGQLMRNGIDLAVSAYPQVKLVFRDSGVLPSQAAKAVDELVRQHKAIAIFGPPLPVQAVAAAKQAEKLGVPLISITAHETFTSLGRFIFRNNFTLSAMGRSVAKYAFNQLRIKRFGMLYPASKYGRIQAKAFLQEIRKLGGMMTSAIEYDPATKDFRMHIKLLFGTTYENAGLLQINRRHMRGLQAYQKKRLRNKVAKLLRPLVPFEGLFIPEQANTVSQIAAYISYFNVGLKRVNLGRTPMFFSPLSRFRKIQLLGNNNWFHKDLFKSGNKYVRGSLLSVRFYPASFRTESQTFVQMYQRTYRKMPIHLSAYSYDAMRLLAHIADSGRVRNRPQFRRALLKIKNFPGPTGPMTVHPNGEVTGAVHFLLAHKGQFRLHGTLK